MNAPIPRLIQFCNGFPIFFPGILHFWSNSVWGLLGGFYFNPLRFSQINEPESQFCLPSFCKKIWENGSYGMTCFFICCYPRMPSFMIWVFRYMLINRAIKILFQEILDYGDPRSRKSYPGSVIDRDKSKLFIFTPFPFGSLDANKSIRINGSSEVGIQIIFFHILNVLRLGLAIKDKTKKAAGRLLDGRTWDELPKALETT